MNIIAVSDLHGNLIHLDKSADILIIAGDWSPLYCQHCYDSMISWIDKKFIPWMCKQNVSDIIFIPGNHDLVCTYSVFEKDLNNILLRHNAINKVHYLNNSSIILNGYKFYGTPNNESPRGWAFSDPYNCTYNFDKDTDILITHQPPMIGNAGFVFIYNKELGSRILRNSIFNSNILMNICGHIHTGEHGEIPVILNNGNHSCVYNVSILDEDYSVAYEPTFIIL